MNQIVLEIGFHKFLMPVTAGTKCLELLSKAVQVDDDVSHILGYVFRPAKRIEKLNIMVVRPEQLLMGNAAVKRKQIPEKTSAAEEQG
jgi:hypothetical protein